MAESNISRKILEKIVEKLGGLNTATSTLGIPTSVLAQYMDGRIAIPDQLLLQMVEVLSPPPEPVNEEQEDFALKLAMIENEANLVADDLPFGVARNRVLHISTTARLLKARFDVASTTITPKPPMR